jgi:hypothetical protein
MGMGGMGMMMEMMEMQMREGVIVNSSNESEFVSRGMKLQTTAAWPQLRHCMLTIL